MALDPEAREIWDTMQVDVIDPDDLRPPQQKVNSAVAEYVWAAGLFWEAPTREDVEAEFARRGAAVVPEPSWLDQVFGDDPAVLDVYSPGAYGTPERRAEHAATLAALRAGEGEHVDLG